MGVYVQISWSDLLIPACSLPVPIVPMAVHKRRGEVRHPGRLNNVCDSDQLWESGVFVWVDVLHDDITWTLA